MPDKQCSVCGGTFSEYDCQSICSKCYNDFFYQNYPQECGVKGEGVQSHGVKLDDPTDI